MHARKGSCLWQQVSLKRASPRRRVTFANPVPGVCPWGQPLAVQKDNVFSWTLSFGRMLFVPFRSRRACLCLPKDKCVGNTFGRAKRARRVRAWIGAKQRSQRQGSTVAARLLRAGAFAGGGCPKACSCASGKALYP